MSFIKDVQNAAISQNTDVPTLLRMCKLLAARIDNRPFAKWVDDELNGYTNIAELPEYRKTHVESYGTFHGPFRHAPQLQIPISILPEKLRERYQYAYMTSGVSAYTHLIEGDKTGSCEEAWPVEIALKYASKLTPEMQCLRAWKQIPLGAVVRLLDSVKTRVLGFAIDLEREAPNAGDAPLGSSTVSQEKVTQIFHTNIYGNVGNVSNAGNNFSQQADISVRPGDWESLRAFLSSQGLPEHGIDGLREALDRVREMPAKDEVERERVKSTWSEKIRDQLSTITGAVVAEGVISAIKMAIETYLG